MLRETESENEKMQGCLYVCGLTGGGGRGGGGGGGGGGTSSSSAMDRLSTLHALPATNNTTADDDGETYLCYYAHSFTMSLILSVSFLCFQPICLLSLFHYFIAI